VVLGDEVVGITILLSFPIIQITIRSCHKHSGPHTLTDTTPSTAGLAYESVQNRAVDWNSPGRSLNIVATTASWGSLGSGEHCKEDDDGDSNDDD